MSQQLGERATLAPPDGLSFLIGPPQPPKSELPPFQGLSSPCAGNPQQTWGTRRYQIQWSVLSVREQRWTEGPASPKGQVCAPSLQDLAADSILKGGVDGLDPHANYTFNVEAQNGVSGLGASKPASASLSINMGLQVRGSGQQGLEKMGSRGEHRTMGTSWWVRSQQKLLK